MMATKTALIALRTRAVWPPKMDSDFTKPACLVAVSADEPASASPGFAPAPSCSRCFALSGMDTLRRFLMLSEPGCFGDRTYSTHDSSKLGVSQIEGMTSSGPDMVHDDDDDEDASGSEVVPAVFVVAWLLSCRESEVLVGSSFSFKEAVDAITQDSPRAGRSMIRGCSVDMAYASQQDMHFV